jgi:OOP family OmpA-OmpF porin
MYEKGATDQGWFGPTFSNISNEDDLGQILSYNESQERLLVGRSKDAQPTYYEVFVTSYKDGIIPPRLAKSVAKDRAMAEIIVIEPQKLEQKMVFVNADEMKRSIADTGKVALYGLYFDTDKDTIRADSAPTMDEIAKLMKANPQMKVRVVGHTDDQGAAAYNLELSKRRASTVVQQLVSKYGIAASRLDSFGAGLYAPVTSNQSEDGQAKNRRVELVEW